MTDLRWAVVTLACGACGFQHGTAPTTDAMPGDGNDSDATDGMVVPSDTNPLCFGTFSTICLEALPTTDFTHAADATYDTDNNTNCTLTKTQTGGPELCVLAARNITINAGFWPIGSRPIVLLATQTLTVNALLDVGSYHYVDGTNVLLWTGAGTASGAALCGSPTAGGPDALNTGLAGGGGGAGGSFGGKGGNGSAGANLTGGTAGAAAPAIGAPSIVRGGCPGTGGGTGGGNAAGVGGPGGGAVLLVAGTRIDITAIGTVRSSGAAGRGGQMLAGGGGAGSGGLIVLDAPTVANLGTVFANSGAGGEGGGNSGNGARGEPGLNPTGRALGGAINANGGDGGRGTHAADIDGEAGQQGGNGGGGGGGGAGVIRVFPAQTLGGTVSPAPT